jgi:hypothetical protein
MWMSGALMAIYERDAIANLRRCGSTTLPTTMSGLLPLRHGRSPSTTQAKHVGLN